MLDENLMRKDLRSVNEFLERRSRWMYSPKKITEEKSKRIVLTVWVVMIILLVQFILL